MRHVVATMLGVLVLSCNPFKPTSAENEIQAPPAPVGPIDCATFRPAQGRFRAPVPSLPRPEKGKVFPEPSFHTCLVRATDHGKEGIDTFSRTDYSRRQAFNADSTLFITNARDGGWHLYDANTFEHLKALASLQGDAEPQWHPTDPSTLYYGERNGGLTIRALDVRDGTSAVAISLAGKLPWHDAARAWTKSEGSPSRDARYWGFQVETEKFEIRGLSVWDMTLGKIVGAMSTRSRPDHVSMSPSGRWLVVSGDNETTAYSRDFSQRRKLRKGGEHSDLAIGADGHDYYVSIDYDDSGWVFMIDIDTGERTNIFRTYIGGAATAMHFSGRAFDKPGWVLVSTYGGSGPPQWFMGKVFAMELAKNARIYQLAVHHSVRKDQYFAEPHATANRDFSRVLFNSNWGGEPELDIDAYMLRLSPAAFP